MLTGMLAVRNMVLGEKNDLWSVNAEQEYLEEIQGVEIPAEEVEAVVEGVFAQAFMKLDPSPFGIAFGTAIGLLLFAATLIVAFAGMTDVQSRLFLLYQYFPGYRVSFVGSFLGLLYGFLSGFLVGWWFAFLRNAVVLLYMSIIYRRAELKLMRKLLDF